MKITINRRNSSPFSTQMIHIAVSSVQVNPCVFCARLRGTGSSLDVSWLPTCIILYRLQGHGNDGAVLLITKGKPRRKEGTQWAVGTQWCSDWVIAEAVLLATSHANPCPMPCQIRSSWMTCSWCVLKFYGLWKSREQRCQGKPDIFRVLDHSHFKDCHASKIISTRWWGT